MSKLYFCT